MRLHKPFALALLLVTSLAVAQEENLTQWAQAMQKEFPPAMCAERALRSCIKVTDAQCHSGISKSTRICIARVTEKSPAKYFSQEQFRKLGSQVGDCAEDLFAIENKQNLDSSPACIEYTNVIQNSKWKTN